MARPEQTKRAQKTEQNKAEHARPAYSRSAQDRFLNQLVQERRRVVVFLTNGIKLEGQITSFDEYAILLEGETAAHIYKHAVSTIQPVTAFAANAIVEARERAPRVRAAGEADATGSVQSVASSPESPAVEGNPRQPVIVIRPKRRLVRIMNGEDR